MSEEDDMSTPIDDELEEMQDESFVPAAPASPAPAKKEEKLLKPPKLPKLKPEEILKEKTPLSFNALAVLAAGFISNSPQLYGCFGSFAEKLQNPYVKTIISVIIYIIIVIGYTKFVSK